MRVQRTVGLRHVARDDLAVQIERALLKAAELVTNGAVTVSVAPRGTPVAELDLLIVLGSPGVAADASVETEAVAAQRAVVPVLPTWDPREPGGFPAQQPKSLHPVNGMQLAGPKDIQLIVEAALQLLGLAESDRRLFISHAREDGARLADQLRRKLQDGRWDVFVDRFDIPPAEHFQRRLESELFDKSYVLLLETVRAPDRPWVEHEVAYARDRNMALTAINIPDAQGNRGEYDVIPEPERLRLDVSQFDGTGSERRLQVEAVESVVKRVEYDHAVALRARREQLLLSARAHLELQRFHVQELQDWVLLATRPGQVEVIVVTPRVPGPRDLRAAHELSARLPRALGQRRTWVLHPLAEVDRGRRALTRWLVGKRRLRVIPIAHFGTELS